MNNGSKVLFNPKRLYIAGHTGFAGRALAAHFSRRDDLTVITAKHSELDLADLSAVERFLKQSRPEAVIIAAGRVGGILANSTHPAEFIFENLAIEMNLIHASWKAGVLHLLNFGSSCMYPKAASQPMRVEDLMTGPLEETSEPYAVAKLAGVTMCSAYNRQYGTRFVSAIPATAYGPGDCFDAGSSHVASALIQKIHQAKEEGKPSVTLWGSGRPRRELLYIEDLAQACDVLLARYEGPSPINVGCGRAYSIAELAWAVTQVVGFRGQILRDAAYPDGAPEKLLDSTPLNRLGWKASVPLEEGLRRTYQWFLEQETAGVNRCAS